MLTVLIHHLRRFCRSTDSGRRSLARFGAADVLEIRDGGSQLIGLHCRKESSFKRISWFVSEFLLFFNNLNPESMLASYSLKRRLRFDETLQKLLT